MDNEVEVKGGAFVQPRPLNDLFVYQSAAKTKRYYACDSSGPIHRSTDTRHGGMTASGFAFAD